MLKRMLDEEILEVVDVARIGVAEVRQICRALAVLARRALGRPVRREFLDVDTDYGPLDRLARHRINIELIIEQWEDILRVAGSLSTGTVRASELIRVLQGGGHPSRLGRAIAELGRVAKRSATRPQPPLR